MTSTLRSEIVLTGVVSSISFLVSFASQMIIGYYFGASAELDAYWVAFSLMNILAFPLSPLREALVPEFHRRVRQGGQVGVDYFSRTMTLILMVASASGVIGYLLAAPLATLAVSANQTEVRELATKQLYWLAPAIVLVAVSETLNTLLVAYHRVIVQSFIRLLGAASTLAVLGMFSGIFHSHVLPIALIFAQITTIVVLVMTLRKQGLSFHFAWPAALGPRFIGLSGALFISYATSQAYAIFEKHTLTSFAAGLVSAFQYATSLTNVLITLVGVTLASVIWPRFLEHAASEDKAHLLADVSVVSRFICLITGWLCVLTWINAPGLVELIYARGAFDAVAVARTVDALRIAVFTAVPISVGMIIGRAQVSIGAAREIMLTGLATAFGGSATLAAAGVIESPSLALSHWLLATSFGVVVQTIFFLRACGHVDGLYGRLGWWVLRWLIVLLLTSITTTEIPVSQFENFALISGIALRSAIASTIFITLAWLLGLMRGIPSPFNQ